MWQKLEEWLELNHASFAAFSMKLTPCVSPRRNATAMVRSRLESRGPENGPFVIRLAAGRADTAAVVRAWMRPEFSRFGSNQMDTTYTEEKFIQAERALTLGMGAIKSRLSDAYVCLLPLTEDDFPEHLREDYRWVIRRLTTKPALRAQFTGKVISGRVSRTLHFMKNRTALTIAERIVYLRARLREYNDQQDEQS
jgi:hypothetical protein